MVIGYSGRPTQLYVNDGGKLGEQPAWSSGNDNTGKPVVAWADVDGDSDLNLIQTSRAAEGMPVFIYLNRGRRLSRAPSPGAGPKAENDRGSLGRRGRRRQAGVGDWTAGNGATRATYPWESGRTPAARLIYKVEGGSWSLHPSCGRRRAPG